MKKNVKIIVSVISVAALAFVCGVKSKNHSMDLFEMNVEALASIEVYGDEETCRTNNGYWNMALVCADGGIISQTCTVSGELTIMGVTIKGNYTAGNVYNGCWARFSCTNSSGNCCNAGEQGIRVYFN
ncbi:MAG: hypothetical protein IJ652_02160 [Bacteroidales bacterium]|nr:hypothetical protein [Bacteroidales bacterium]